MTDSIDACPTREQLTQAISDLADWCFVDGDTAGRPRWSPETKAARESVSALIDQLRAEVERLRGDNRRFHTDAPDETKWSGLVQANSELRAEVERLRGRAERLGGEVERLTAERAAVAQAMAIEPRHPEMMRRIAAIVGLERGEVDKLAAEVKRLRKEVDLGELFQAPARCCHADCDRVADTCHAHEDELRAIIDAATNLVRDQTDPNDTTSLLDGITKAIFGRDAALAAAKAEAEKFRLVAIKRSAQLEAAHRRARHKAEGLG